MDVDEAGHQLELGQLEGARAWPEVGREGLHRQAAGVPQQRRVKGVGGRTGDERRQDPVVAMYLPEQLDLAPDPLRSRGLGRAHHDQAPGLTQGLANRRGEVRPCPQFVLVPEQRLQPAGAVQDRRLSQAEPARRPVGFQRPMEPSGERGVRAAVTDEGAVADGLSGLACGRRLVGQGHRSVDP